MQNLCIKLQVALSLFQLLPIINMVLSNVAFNALDNAYLCIRSDFVNTHPTIFTIRLCAMMCSLNHLCQAFTMNDGPCQLFVFNKCSKSVRDCSCSRRGQVFVKQQPGLAPGALCPPGYGDDLCGVKYKVLNGSDYWWPSRAKCENESGLVIMADVVDATELSHVESLYIRYRPGLFISMWVGGYQPAGSAEPLGGWYWVGCNITVSNSLWKSGEPNNHLSRENVMGRDHAMTSLVDFWDMDGPFPVMCECVSPFE